MSRMLFQLERRVKMQVRKLRRDTRDKALAQRCQIILLADKRRTKSSIAESTGLSISWVWRVIGSFRDWGIAALYDGRADNGQLKLDERFLGALTGVLDGNARQWGFARPTWTQELLVKVMQRHIGVRVHRATMSRALALIGARLGRPRPMVGCPWPHAAKTRRLNQIQQLINTVPEDERVFYEDEVDIHLNPKIGPDWMNRGTQKQVLTPGNNAKQYLAGALDARTGELTWVKGAKKNSQLFIRLMDKLVDENPEARVIHLVLDNFKIHTSLATRAALARYKGKVKPHFLPPYCPEGNRIERRWLDLHANVTRNHRCKDMTELMTRVYNYLWYRNQRIKRQAKEVA